jgi:glucose uptake protein
MNFPIQGLPIGFTTYFRGTRREHLLGVLGGAIWCAGTVANFAASGAQATLGPAISYGLGQGATLVSALWGLLVWKEFAGANQKVKMFLIGMIVLFVVGLTLVSIAPLYPMSR